MGGQREWFKHDAWYLADGKIRSLGHRFGAEGVLVAEAVLQLAKRQKNGGEVTVEWSELTEHAFVKGRAGARPIVERMQDPLKLIEVVRADDFEVTLQVCGWVEYQGQGMTEAERKRAERARKAAESHTDCPDMSRDIAVTSPDIDRDLSRASALAKEKELRETPNGVSRPISSKLEKARAKATDDDKALCRLLAEHIKGRNDKFKVKAEAQWLDQMRLLREQDGNPPAHIRRLIDWIFTAGTKDAEFWAKTVQSTANLRENFPRIWGQMLAAGKPKGGPLVESSDDYLARREGR